MPSQLTTVEMASTRIELRYLTHNNNHSHTFVTVSVCVNELLLST